MIVCAGGNENFSFAKAIGIGLVESAFHLSILMSLLLFLAKKLKMSKAMKNLIFNLCLIF